MGWLHDAPTCRASSTPAARLTGYHRFRAQGLQPGGGGSLDRLARRFCEHLQVQNHTGICLWLLAGQEQELRSGAVRGCPARDYPFVPVEEGERIQDSRRGPCIAVGWATRRTRSLRSRMKR